MLSIAIVDDEQLIINHLIKIILSSPFEVKIVGTATNTDDALQMLQKTKPNLVLVDICIRDSNGLDLCKTMKVTMPYTKIIIISGYSNFEYAQKAINCNVISYLLKPINEGELIKHLEHVNLQIQEELQSLEDSFRLKEQIQDCLPLMIDWFFQVIQASGDDVKKVRESFDLFDADILNEGYQIIFVDFKNNADNFENSLYKIASISKTLALFSNQHSKCIYFYNAHSITLLLSYDDIVHEKINRASYQTAEKIQAYLSFNITEEFSIGLSTPFNSISQMKNACSDAKSASSYSFFIGFHQIICITDTEQQVTSELPQCFSNIQNEVLHNLKICNSEETHRSLCIFYHYLLQLKRNIHFTKNKYLELYFYLENAIEQEFGYLKYEENSYLDTLSNASDLSTLKEVLDSYVETTIQVIYNSRQTKSSQLVENAKALIIKKYTNSITLDSIAWDIGISACYLSTLFKKIEGIPLRDFIIQTRIEAAKDLLRTPEAKIYEVSTAVGYSDSRYFSQIFRKITGFTPSQYREFVKEENTSTTT